MFVRCSVKIKCHTWVNRLFRPNRPYLEVVIVFIKNLLLCVTNICHLRLTSMFSQLFLLNSCYSIKCLWVVSGCDNEATKWWVWHLGATDICERRQNAREFCLWLSSIQRSRLCSLNIAPSMQQNSAHIQRLIVISDQLDVSRMTLPVVRTHREQRQKDRVCQWFYELSQARSTSR